MGQAVLWPVQALLLAQLAQAQARVLGQVLGLVLVFEGALVIVTFGAHFAHHFGNSHHGGPEPIVGVSRWW